MFLIGDPIDSSWKNAAAAKHRFDFNSWYLWYCGMSIFFDLAILCFPLPVIRTLKVNTRRKASIMAIFWLGGFVCISAIVRFVLFYRSINGLTDFGENQYSSITSAFIWSEIEPNTSVIAACLPTYGPFFKENGVVPRFVHSVKSSLGMSTASERGADASMQSKVSAGYLELKRTTNTKGSAGDIIVGRTTTGSATPDDDDNGGGERGEGSLTREVCAKQKV